MLLDLRRLALSAGCLLFAIGCAFGSSSAGSSNLLIRTLEAHWHNCELVIRPEDAPLSVLEYFLLEPSRDSLREIQKQLLEPESALRAVLKVFVRSELLSPGRYLKRYALYRTVIDGCLSQEEIKAIEELLEPLTRKYNRFLNVLVGHINDEKVISLLRDLDETELAKVWNAFLQYRPEQLSSIILRALDDRFTCPGFLRTISVDIIYSCLVRTEDPGCYMRRAKSLDIVPQLFALSCYSDIPHRRIYSWCLENYQFLYDWTQGESSTEFDAQHKKFGPNTVPFKLYADMFPLGLPKPLAFCPQDDVLAWNILRLPLSILNSYANARGCIQRPCHPSDLACVSIPKCALPPHFSLRTFVDVWKSSQPPDLLSKLRGINRCLLSNICPSNVHHLMAEKGLPQFGFLLTLKDVLKCFMVLRLLYSKNICRSEFCKVLETCWEGYVKELENEDNPSIEEYLLLYDAVTGCCKAPVPFHKIRGMSENLYIKLLIEKVLAGPGCSGKWCKIPPKLLDECCPMLAEALDGREECLVSLFRGKEELYFMLAVNLLLSRQPVSKNLVDVLISQLLALASGGSDSIREAWYIYGNEICYVANVLGKAVSLPLSRQAALENIRGIFRIISCDRPSIKHHRASFLIDLCMDCKRSSEEEYKYLINSLASCRGYCPSNLLTSMIGHMWEGKSVYNSSDLDTAKCALDDIFKSIATSAIWSSALHHYFLEFLKTPGARDKIKILVASEKQVANS